MIFRRSPSSLDSLPKFYKVDVVVFCEGGSPVGISQAVALSDDRLTLDTHFWSRVTELQGLPGRYHFKSVGSKPTLQAIAQDIEARNINNITVCLDSDYDHLLACATKGSRVAHTYGYSWENDVVIPDVIKELLGDMLGNGAKQDIIKAGIADALKKFQKEIAPWCEADISLKKKNKPSIFHREKPLFCVDVEVDPLKLKIDTLRSRLGTCGYSRRPRRVVHVNASEALHRTYGKLVSRAIFHAFRFAIKKADPSLNIQYEAFMRLCISKLFSMLSLGQLPDIRGHYVAQSAAFALQD